MAAQRRPGESKHLALGRRGEDVAARYLESAGFTVLARNWRRREGELDIIATDGEIVVVCEVKTRAGVGFGAPAEAVTREKAARIRRLATQWLSEWRARWIETVRFDVIAVVWPPGGSPQVTHIPGAF
jgi:putative endonuclease